MTAPKPPFRSVSEELLYNIYLKVSSGGGGISPNDIDTLAKLNSFLTDAVLMKADDIMSAINTLKGNVPAVANSLEKLYGIIQGLTFLKREDIDHLSELNAIIQDADLVRTEDLTNAVTGIKGNVPPDANTLEKLYGIIQGLTFLKREDIDHLAELNAIVEDADLIRAEDLTSAVNGIKGNVPVNGNTLEKLYNLIQGFSFLKREDIDTIGELNSLVTDGDLVRVEDLAEALVSLNLKRKTLQFFLEPNFHDRNVFVLRGRMNSIVEDFTTSELNSVSYKSRLDNVQVWTDHANVVSLQNWINQSVIGNDMDGTKYWIKCIGNYKQGRNGDAVNLLSYHLA